MIKLWLGGLLAVLCLVGAPAIAASVDSPIVIAHRGASGYRPEHTRAAYLLAIEQGADYIEPDLVMTRDGVLVARHENEIGVSTDVAAHPEFADRRTTRTIEGEIFTGWFAEDFTLAEIKTLRARERAPARRPVSASHDGREQILTLQEIIDLVRAAGRPVGLYIELKNPNYHASIGLPMERKLVETLAANDLNRRDAPVFLQSFWPQTLQSLRQLTPLRCVFLINSVPPPAEILRANGIAAWSDVYSPAGLRKIASFADGVGPELDLLLPRDRDGRLIAPTQFVTDAHAAGLFVHPWSVSAENPALPTDLRRGNPSAAGYQAKHGDAEKYFRALYALGVDGIFTDYPDIAVRARAR
ncbi:glycerophosphodiester phosphodiesterase [Steroidobacter sp. S1-65]|uniref:glycerophosphodiester phosphodiesterase n=1 Tax=Steroidobacter gossypii TaxID=2805490 RepID=A0ABS1X2P4_9GAMM|nr:glycerophosphodiester phosphodiesterase [Steroidobacter gossypii]MBM0107485.1 glycerophosphodiester phosphodiesterase [Steroidobacter gossypii]